MKAGILAALRNLTKSDRSTSTSRRTTKKQATKAATKSARRRTTQASRSTAGSTSGSTSGGTSGRVTANAPAEATELGDYAGTPVMEYRPRDDGRPDPGEIVWTWVPYEENDGRGKDRPVLIVGRDDDTLLALMLTSKDHDRDAAQEARAGRHWTDIGAGDWDPQHRPSEVRLDRVLRIDPSGVRREGAVLSRTTFDHVATEVARVHRQLRT